MERYPCRYAPFFHTNIRSGKAAAPPGSHCLPSGLGGTKPAPTAPRNFCGGNSVAPPYADGATEFPGRKFRCAGRAKPAPWLSHRESWHGAAVTERVPCSNQRTFSIFATANALSGSPLARQLPHRGSQGRLRRRIPADLPSGPGGLRLPLWTQRTRQRDTVSFFFIRFLSTR